MKQCESHPFFKHCVVKHLKLGSRCLLDYDWSPTARGRAGLAASSWLTSCWTWLREREWWTSTTVWGSYAHAESTWSRQRYLKGWGAIDLIFLDSESIHFKFRKSVFGGRFFPFFPQGLPMCTLNQHPMYWRENLILNQERLWIQNRSWHRIVRYRKESHPE